MKHIFSFFNLFALALLLLGIWGLAFVNRPMEKPEVPSYVLNERMPVQVAVYYISKDGSGLASELRNVPVVFGDKNPLGMAEAALTMWAQGPATEGLRRTVPADAEVPKVWLRGDNYFVNLPESYRGLGFSTSAEHLMLCSITMTLLEKSGLDVTFLVNNTNTTSIGAMDLRQPLTRQDCPKP